MTSPTVTAVSDEHTRELAAYYDALATRAGGMSLTDRGRALRTAEALCELLRARSALADVGERCPNCDGEGFEPCIVGAHTTHAGVGEKQCENCNGTGKIHDVVDSIDPEWSRGVEYPCPNCTGKQPRPAAEVLVVDDAPYNQKHSPAAHTAQVTEEEREALDWAATQADEYANECDLLHYGHECEHARRARLLRRLAEQGSAKP